MNNKYILTVFTVLVFSCSTKVSDEPLLSAGREAPLGWVVFKLLDETNFELQNNGIRAKNSKVYPGTYLLKQDTLFLKYKIAPEWKGCDRGIINGKSIQFEDCLGSLSIWINNLENPNNK